MEKYLVVAVRTYHKGFNSEEWVELETADKKEAVGCAKDLSERTSDTIEVRKVTEVIDTDDEGEMVNYDYELVEYKG